MSIFSKIAETLMERLRAVKFSLPAEIHNVLGITKEDIDSFFDESLRLSPQGIVDAIEDIVANAYETSPIFKKLVDEDVEKDPARLGRSAKVVSSLLKFLKSNLPAEKRKAIKDDSFEQAHQIIKNVLKDKLFKPVEEEKKEVEPEIGIISENELSLFKIPGTSGIKIDHTTKWNDVKNNILFFLNKLKTPDGKKIKNEATLDMSDDLKINILAKFLNTIRTAKINKFGRLTTFEESWLGKNKNHLYAIAKAMATKPEPKKEIIRKEDIVEVNQMTVEALLLLNRIIELFNSRRMKLVIENYDKLLDELLMPVDEFNKNIEKIRSAIDKLSLSRIQKAALLNVDIIGLSYNDPVKKIEEDKKMALKAIEEEIKTKGETEDLNKKKKNIEKILKEIEELKEKDKTEVEKAIRDYLEKLSEISKKVSSLFTLKEIDKDKALTTFVSLVEEFFSKFSKLSREEIFRARWEGRHGFLFRDIEEKEAGYGIEKFAADYASKIEQFRKKGIKEIFEEISDIINSEDKLLLIREKMLSSLELKPENVLNVTKKDYTGNPLGGKEIKLEEALDILNRLKTLLNKIDLDKKREELKELLYWMASLHTHIGVSKIKKQSSWDRIIKLAKLIIGEEQLEKSLTKDVGRGRPYKAPSEAGWFIYRERLTKAGRKALQNFFEEPTFVQNFVEEMEKEGLNTKLLHGAKDKPVDIEPILEKVIQKTLGKKGSFENILGSRVMQQFKTEFDIKKLDKEIEETKERLNTINRELHKLDEKYFPKIREFAKFLEDPIAAMSKYISKLREKRVEVKKELEEKKEVPIPLPVNKGNYQDVLLRLTQKYLGRSSGAVKLAFFNKNDIPSVVVKKYINWKKDLEEMEKKVEEQKDPYRRAVLLKDYYETMNNGIIKIIDYIKEQKDILEADRKTIENLEKFLNSEKAKEEKESVIEKAKDTLSHLKKVFDVQNRYFQYLEKHFKIEDMEKLKEIVEKNLFAIKDDIKDKEVDLLYQVAISPELRPIKEEAKKIIEKAKEKERLLSELVDRDTFKKNMLKLLSFKAEKYDFVSPEGKPFILPPERKKELEESLKEYEENVRKIKQYVDYTTKKLALDRLIEKVEKDKKDIKKSKERIDVYQKVIQNLEYLERNKANMSEEEYKKEKNKIYDLLEGKEISVEQLKRDINKELDFIEEKEKELFKVEKEIEELKREVEKKKPPVDVKLKLRGIEDELYRLRGIDQPRATKLYTDEEIIEILEKKLERLYELDKISLPIEKGSKEELEFNRLKKEIKNQIESTKKRIEQIERYKKTAAVEKEKEPLSPYEIALETKGVAPAPFFKELKKPKGWEFVEEFFEKVKKEYKEISELKDKKPLEFQSHLEKRKDLLEKVLKAIDAFKNMPLINIGGEFVAFRDALNRFDELVLEYENNFRKLVNQREDAINRLISLKQQREYLSKFFDPETGEFKGFDKEEIENLKGIFLRMLYRDLDRYWATKVGKNLSVFGERETEWYNNVYNTFKNMANVKSNRKIINLINKYKQEVKADLDEVATRLKVDQLKKRLDRIVRRYKELASDNLKELKKKKEELVERLEKLGRDPNKEEVVKELDKKIHYLETYGVDPTKSEVVRELINRIETLEKQQKQIERLFNIMGAASATALHAEFEKMLKEKAKQLGEEEFKETKVNLEEKTNKMVNQIAEELENNIDNIIDITKILEDVEKALTKGEEKLNIKEVEKEEERIKKAYSKEHPDFNLKILYSDTIQNKILDLLKEEIKVY